MAWYDEAVFYHIYPLGLLGAPKQNPYGEPVHRLRGLWPWIGHIRDLGCNALYIGPLFESVGHGYETTDYKKLDSRLGDNQDLKDFVAECHRQGIRVILDGVFNHTGRDFFAFQDLKANRESSPYRDWYCNVNFWGNNEYNDGFSYDNWGGYNLLAKLNQRNPAVRSYICDVIRFWVSEFDIDGLRLDAADVLDFDFMKELRYTANTVKPDFWLMGEVIHGDYSRWANNETLHSVTNYMLHKAFYSGHNDHNYFEIAHTLRYVSGMTGNAAGQGLRLYHFVDNHDVERISTKLTEKAQFVPVHILLYTLPGIPSIYYGSEFGIAGRKERYSDDSLRPSLRLSDLMGTPVEGELEDLVTTGQVEPGLNARACAALIAALGKARTTVPALCYGGYEEKLLTTRQYAFARNHEGQSVIVMANNDENPYHFQVGAPNGTYRGLLSGQIQSVEDGCLRFEAGACSGEVWIPAPEEKKDIQATPVQPFIAAGKAEAETEVMAEAGAKTAGEAKEEAMPEAPAAQAEPTEPAEKPGPVCVCVTDPATETKAEEAKELPPVPDKPYEEMEVEELQSAILAKMARNGQVTSQMRRDVENNIWKDSLLNWVKSFR